MTWKLKVVNRVTASSVPSIEEFTLQDLQRMDRIHVVPGNLTLKQIVVNLNWKSFRKLTEVSDEWKQACEGRLIYNARVRGGSTQTVDVECYPGKIDLSDEEGGRYTLPSIPHVDGGFPGEYQSVVAGGKVYVIGGMKSITFETGTVWTASNDVYCLDLAGHGEWKACAPMKVPRYNFGCCVKNGRIFVYGGKDSEMAASTQEFFDLDQNAWYLFEPTSKRRWHGSTGKSRVQI